MWLSNPAASPAFGPTVAGLGGLLFAALGALVVVERGRLWGSVLFRRWLTWALIVPIYVLGVLSGPLVALLFVSALSWQALREYAALVGLPPAYRRVLLAGGLLPGAAALPSRRRARRCLPCSCCWGRCRRCSAATCGRARGTWRCWR